MLCGWCEVGVIDMLCVRMVVVVVWICESDYFIIDFNVLV